MSALRRVATIESIGSSTRIEGSHLSDRDVERLLANLEIKAFDTRDEQEVAGYAEVMETVFAAWQDLVFPENHVRQLHRDLLVYSEKDAWHRGSYKTGVNRRPSLTPDRRAILIPRRFTAPDWQPWLRFFLRAMQQQMRRLANKVEREKLLLAAIPELALRIVDHVRDHGRVTMAEAVTLTGASRNTLKEHLRTSVAISCSTASAVALGIACLRLAGRGGSPPT